MLLAIWNALVAWFTRRRARREIAAFRERWMRVLGSAVAAGAEIEQNRDPIDGAMLTALHDVAPESRPEIEGLGFKRLHAECETWVHRGPALKAATQQAPSVTMPGRRARLPRGRATGA